MNRRIPSLLAAAVVGLSMSGAVSADVISNTTDQVDRTHYVRLSAGALAQAAGLDLTPSLDINYGSFRWLELTDEQIAKLNAAGVPFTEKQDAFMLRLGENAFDPIVDGQPVEPASLNAIRRDGPDMHLVQFKGPAKQEWLDQLNASGLRVVKYLHPYTYVVWGDLEQRAVANQQNMVRWTGEFKPAYRLLPDYRNLGRNAIDVKVMVYRGSDVNAVVQSLGAAGGADMERAVIDRTFEFVKVTIAADKLESLAAIPGVYSVKPVPTDGGLRGEMFNQVNVNNVDGTNLAFPGYETWLSGVGLDGAGVIIANVDGGVQDTHPDLVNRMLVCTGPTCGGSSSSSHGTHTAGIMAGDGVSGTLDSAGFNRGLGVAPGANLVEQVYSPHFTEAGGMLKLMKDSWNNGASLSGNSWGPAGTPRGYDDDTYQVDVGVRDSVDTMAGNQELTYVLSFMNGNGGFQTQGTPDEAKNIFNIGSTKGQTAPGVQILDIDDLSSNSAHGPALDGRTIPHMVAPGCSIDSTDTTSSYGLKCGTSMASPHVSGAVALFIEYYRNLPGFIADPSPALVKAAFLPVAHSLAGNLDADGGTLGQPFDSKQGWGRMDLEAVVDPIDSVRYFDNPQVFDNTGEEWTLSVSPADPARPMRMMLVWTDAPGHGLGGSTPAWNNDLDLIVEAGATTYRGNNIGASGWTTAGGSADAINNTEGVFLGPTPPGAVTVRVVATDINSDAIPGVGDGTDQDFAFVCYNCAEEPGFGLSATPSSTATCDDDTVMVNVDVPAILGFAEPVTLSTTGEPAGSLVNFSTNPVVPGGSSVMTVSNMSGAAAGTYVVNINGMSASLSRDTATTIELSTMAPGAPGITSPSNGATGVSLVPTFMWSAPAQAATYDFQLATSASFGGTVIDSGTTTDPEFTSAVTLDPDTLYYARVRASNPCGDGSYSAVISFRTRDVPAVLLVDDDDNSPDARSYYTDALDGLGIDYDLWDTVNTDNEPAINDLNQYVIVIWFTGDEFGGAAGPGSAGESALASWLDGGDRCLIMSSQDYLYDRGLTSFLSGYLGVASYSSDVSQGNVTGSGSVYGGMGPYTLSFPFSNWSDRVTPDGTAELAFSGSAGDAAVNKDAGTYRTSFFGFPLEALSMSERMLVIDQAVSWCAPPPPNCPGDANGDLMVDFDDLNEVLTSWNTAVPAGTMGDVTGNGFVDFDDLNEVLTFWGVICN